MEKHCAILRKMKLSNLHISKTTNIFPIFLENANKHAGNFPSEMETSFPENPPQSDWCVQQTAFSSFMLMWLRWNAHVSAVFLMLSFLSDFFSFCLFCYRLTHQSPPRTDWCPLEWLKELLSLFFCAAFIIEEKQGEINSLPSVCFFCLLACFFINLKSCSDQPFHWWQGIPLTGAVAAKKYNFIQILPPTVTPPQLFLPPFFN